MPDSMIGLIYVAQCLKAAGEGDKEVNEDVSESRTYSSSK